MQSDAWKMWSPAIVHSAFPSITGIAAHALASVLVGRPPIDAAKLLTDATGVLPLVVVDRAGRIVEWSLGCATLYGWSRDEALGQIKHILLQSRECMAPPLWPPAGDRRTCRLKERGRNGKLLSVIETTTALGADCFLLSMADVNALVEPDALVCEDAALLALTKGMDAVGVFEVDVCAGSFHWANDPWQMFGAATGSMPLAELWKRFDPRDAETMAADIETATQTREAALHWHTQIATTRAGLRVIDTAIQLIYDDQGEMKRIIGVMLDLTEQKARERALSISRGELQSILDTVPDGMIVADSNGLVRAMSRTAATMLGYDDQLPALLRVDAILPESWSVIRHRAERGRTYDTIARRADGREIPLELRAGEATYGGGAAYTLFIADMSGRMASGERRDALLNRHAQASTLSAVGEFAAQLSHEINQPFTALGNYLAAAQGMLQQNGDTARAEDMLGQALLQAKRATDILKRMQRLVAHREVELQTVALSAIVEEAIALMPTVAWPGVGVRYIVRPGAGKVLVDPVQIQQVLANLLRNSVQAPPRRSGERRIIKIEAKPRGELVMISVRDNGAGVDPQVLPRLFNPFTSTKGSGGMGLGLSVCRSIIEAHGGTIGAGNADAGGAIVSFTVPRADAAAE